MKIFNQKDKNVKENINDWAPLYQESESAEKIELLDSFDKTDFEPLILESNEEIISDLDDNLEKKIVFEPLITQNEDTPLSEEPIDISFEPIDINKALNFNELDENIGIFEIIDEENNKKSINNLSESYKSLELLTNYAIISMNLEDITIDEFINIEKTLNEQRKKYEKLLKVKQEERDNKIAKSNAFLEMSTKITKVRNENIDNVLEYYRTELDEYEKIKSEYNKEKELLEKSYSDLVEIISKNSAQENLSLIEEISQFINDGFPKQTAYQLLSKYGNDLHLPNSIAYEIVENLQKICKLKWNSEAYEEYIAEFYSESHIEELKNEIEELESTKQSDSDIKQMHDEYTFNLFEDSSYIDNDGNISYDIEKYDIDLLNEKSKIKKLENILLLIKSGYRHPQMISDEIKKLIEENFDKEQLKEKVNELLRHVDIERIKNDNIGQQEKMDAHRKITSLINERNEKEKIYDELKRSHDNEEYKNDINYINDLKRLQKYVNKDKKIDEEIANVTAVNNRKDNIKKFAIANIVIKIKDVEKKKLERKKQKYLKNNNDLSNQDKIDMIDKEITTINELIRKCRNKRKIYYREISRAKGFINKKTLEELLNEKEINKKRIKQLIEEINDKKKNYGYIDQDLKLSLEESITDLNNNIKNLENIGQHTINKLADDVINYDKAKNEKKELTEEKKNNIEELQEIVSVKEPKKGLLDKIRSINFKKIMNSALTKIALAVTTVSLGAGIMFGMHQVKNDDNSTKNKDLDKLNNSDKIVEETEAVKDVNIEQEIENVVNNQNSDVKIEFEKSEENNENIVGTDIKDIKDFHRGNKVNNNLVDITKLTTNIDASLKHDYINPKNIKVEKFVEENIVGFEVIQRDGQYVRKVYGKNGTGEPVVLAFENVTDNYTNDTDNYIERKTR